MINVRINWHKNSRLYSMYVKNFCWYLTKMNEWTILQWNVYFVIKLYYYTHLFITRCWVARNFTVWRTHTRTSIIDPHALPHRTLIFGDRTRTRTRTFSKRVQSFISLSKKDCTFTALSIFFFYLTENVLTTYYYTYTNPFIFHYLSSPDTFPAHATLVNQYFSTYLSVF